MTHPLVAPPRIEPSRERGEPAFAAGRPRLGDRVHFFTVDVEEPFQARPLRQAVTPARWGDHPSRVEAGVDRLLALLAEADATATFFVTPWVATRSPGLVKRISALGHEVAARGMSAIHPERTSAARFRDEIRGARDAIQDATGTTVRGFRAGAFSTEPGGEWMLDMLAAEGFEYDSSRARVVQPRAGLGPFHPHPHTVTSWAGSILEVPLTSMSVCGVTLMTTAGGALRHLPFAAARAGLRGLSRRGERAVFQVHSWEVDADQPRLGRPGVARLRHYAGLERTTAAVQRLLAELRFTSIGAELSELRRCAPAC